jgi:hypothetical protein
MDPCNLISFSTFKLKDILKYIYVIVNYIYVIIVNYICNHCQIDRYVILIAEYVVSIGIVLSLLQMGSNTHKLLHIVLQLSSTAMVGEGSALSFPK